MKRAHPGRMSAFANDNWNKNETALSHTNKSSRGSFDSLACISGVMELNSTVFNKIITSFFGRSYAAVIKHCKEL